MSRSQPRAPGSFSPLPAPGAPTPPPTMRPPPRRLDSHSSENGDFPDLTINKTRQQPNPSVTATPIYSQFSTAQSNASTPSLHYNYSRPDSHSFSRPAASVARIPTHGSSSPLVKHHTRKHSATPGLFEPSLPSTTVSNLSHLGASQSTTTLSASQIAAQAAVMSHQNSQQQHSRQRSQTVPFPGEAERRGSASKRTASPMAAPMLSLTEASAPRDTGFGAHGGHHMDRMGNNSHSSAAAAAANLVFPRSGHSSPSQSSALQQQQMPPPMPPPPVPEKMSKSDKAKAKLFSRPGKISTKSEPKEKPLPSPGKIGSALSALQRGNFSTTSLVDPGVQSLYNHNNSSTATIRPIEIATDEKKEKEKKHHFLSRQKHKLKDEYHLPLSSAASNSRPTDPNAPSSLYNFNIPPSPGPSSSTFGVKAKKDKKHAERSESRIGEDSTVSGHGEWPTPSSLPSLSQQSTMYDPVDPGKLGLHNHMSLDDAWPYLKAKLLVIFEGEDLRLPVEDFNRVVQMHIQYCIHRRSPNSMLEDLRDLLTMGFSSLDRTLRKTPEDRFIPALVELWLFTFTSILPYIQSIFLPLDLEVSGCGTLMTPAQARDFWGGVMATSSADRPARVSPVATVLDVRRLVLTAYRDIVILPRYDTLKTIFSRLSLEFLPSSFAALASPTPESASFSTSPPDSLPRPGTAMSLDPSLASYNSTSTTLLGDIGDLGSRSRAISNVSFGSDGFQPRPFTPSAHQGTTTLGSLREQNVEDSKQVTDMVGRMLQCMSVLSSLGGVDDADAEGNRKMVELCKMLKLNWLGRGRTGRNRMGIVGGRVRRGEELRVS